MSEFNNEMGTESAFCAVATAPAREGRRLAHSFVLLLFVSSRLASPLDLPSALTVAVASKSRQWFSAMEQRVYASGQVVIMAWTARVLALASSRSLLAAPLPSRSKIP